jgi:pseudaminic acid synthase
MKKELKIGNRTISKNDPVFIIAELSCNHVQDLEIAKKTILAMKESGADCVKVQTYTADTMTLNSRDKIFMVDNNMIWDGMNLYDLYEKATTPWEWTAELKKLTEDLGMIFFSSPFDPSAVDFLEEHNMPAYKIASFEINDIPLIEAVAKTGKPMIISTGVAHKEDIDLAIQTCLDNGNDQVMLLKCTSGYPTPMEEVNLRNMNQMRDDYDCLVGVSDHTLGSLVPSAAVAQGARVIEKHFILNDEIDSYDSEFSMNPEEFKEMVDRVRETEKLLGTNDYVISEKKIESRTFMRSLFFTKDLKDGDIITEDSVKCIRPSHGLHPKYYKDIIGKKINCDVKKHTPINKDSISGL